MHAPTWAGGLASGQAPMSDAAIWSLLSRNYDDYLVAAIQSARNRSRFYNDLGIHD